MAIVRKQGNKIVVSAKMGEPVKKCFEVARELKEGEQREC